jgi:hypothetical protein
MTVIAYKNKKMSIKSGDKKMALSIHNSNILGAFPHANANSRFSSFHLLKSFLWRRSLRIIVHTFHKLLWRRCSLIRRMLRRDPSDRASIDQVLGHDWLRPMFDRWRMRAPGDNGHVTSRGQPIVEGHHRSLVAVEALTPEDHEYIVDTVVAGEMTTREELLRLELGFTCWETFRPSCLDAVPPDAHLYFVKPSFSNAIFVSSSCRSTVNVVKVRRSL